MEETSPRGARVVPTGRSGDWAARAVVVDRHGLAAGCYQRFAWKLRRSLAARAAASVAVTSAVRHEGKTVTACNLALALASFGRDRVALLDLDMRGPSVAASLGLRPEVGIERYLSGETSLREIRVATDVRGLDVFPAREPQPGAHELLGTPELVRLLGELRRAYDLIVVDTPPVLAAPDAPLILHEVECGLLVARAGHTRPAALRQALEPLPREKLLGVFLNSARSVEQSNRYDYYEKKS